MYDRNMEVLNMFPYDNQFAQWCEDVCKWSTKSIYLNTYIISDFFSYLREAKLPDDPQKILPGTIKVYILHLQTDRNLSNRTINKYLTSIRRYFHFLYVYNLTNNYPMADVRGLYYNRAQTFTINWQYRIPDMIGKVTPETILLLTAIALGYAPEELLGLKREIVQQVNNTKIRDYIEDYLITSKSPTFFITRRGHTPKSMRPIINNAKKDEKNLHLKLTPVSLRQGFIYSQVSDPKLSDMELSQRLHCSLRRITYYKDQLQNVHLQQFEF